MMGMPLGSVGYTQEPGNANQFHLHRRSMGSWQPQGQLGSPLPPDRIRSNRFGLPGKQVVQGEDMKMQLQQESNRMQGQGQMQGQVGWRMGNQEGRNSGVMTPQDIVQDKRQGALQQLQDNYNDCLIRFSELISKKTLDPNDVKQYLLAKETPVPPKLFTVQYAVPPPIPLRLSNPPPPPESRIGVQEEWAKIQSTTTAGQEGKTTPLPGTVLKADQGKEAISAKSPGPIPTNIGIATLPVSVAAVGVVQESKPQVKAGEKDHQCVNLKKMFALRRQDQTTTTTTTTTVVSTSASSSKPSNDTKQN